MKKIISSFVFIFLFFLATALAHASHSIDFTINYFDAYYRSSVMLTFNGELPNTEGATCEVIDTGTNVSVDTTYFSTFEGQQVINFTFPKEQTPLNWTPTSTYYLSCTLADTSVINSNDFKYIPAPTIAEVIQNENLIDIYFLPHISTYTPAGITTYPNLWLHAQTGWFDSLSIYPLENDSDNCEENVTHNATTVSVCHFDLNGNPELPSNDDVTFVLELEENNVRYIVNTSTFHVTTINEPSNPPIISSLTGASIEPNETYSENVSFTDADSSEWLVSVDYGDGSNLEQFYTTETTFPLSHTYTTTGTYTVNVTINDLDNGLATETATVTVSNAQPTTITFSPMKDTYIRDGSDNHNYGAGIFMRLQSSGNNRSMLAFDQGELQAAIQNGTILSAVLQVSITYNGNNWGSTGRTIDLHRLTQDWDEGNGTENNRGTGTGATWSCSIDSIIANQAKNCSGATEWEMGQPNNPAVHPWVQTASDTKTITNNQAGIVEFDVTGDLTNFLNGSATNYGWILKKTNEGQNGQVSFGTKESTTPPQLVITYQE